MSSQAAVAGETQYLSFQVAEEEYAIGIQRVHDTGFLACNQRAAAARQVD